MSGAVLAIDPGSSESAFVVYNPATGGIRNAGKHPNQRLLDEFRRGVSIEVSWAVIEKVESFGMAVGAEVFETVYWSGRFAEALTRHLILVDRIGRRAVKLHLCGQARAKDANIRQALLDRFGGKGTKKAPGALYGISGDLWSALAVAVTWSDLHVEQAA